MTALNKKIALIFPGQGAQYVGMGKDIFQQYDIAKDLFKKAQDILDFDISKLCFEGPEEQLKSTINSQPAIFLVSYICLKILRDKLGDKINPEFTAGLSLGEYTALTASGVLSFEDGLRLVRKRGEYMEEAAHINKGQMLSLIGVDRQTAQNVAKESGCECANFNAPGQVVLSGSVECIKNAQAVAQTQGVKKTILLDVSGPFHCSLMKPAQDRLKEKLDTINFKSPTTNIVSNVTALAESNPAKIKENLIKQLISATYWEDSMKYLASSGVNYLIEIGPGKVLKGLQKRIDPNIPVSSVGTVEELESTTSQMPEI